MNIKRAKEEIKRAIRAYLLKNEFGEYCIPTLRQRPILLIGPPGIGKTQIMEQISKECGINLVAYTITHHTRQSAIGLPFIRQKTYGEKEYSVTEYTMSEIIASVYDKIEKTGISEGILFIDEINCVSETLAPAMLQFLQYKTFGNQAVPQGWIIVAAGNPPEFNKSVRDFDLVTLDRLKRIDVEADFPVWKEYAYQQGVHQAIISYLDIKPEYFYKIETSIDGKEFATARGWEDLSQFIQIYESLNLKIDREVVHQYIQHWTIAKDFASYLELFYRYQKDYHIDEILAGQRPDAIMQRIPFAPFDEKLSLVNLLLSRLSQMFHDCYIQDQYITMLFGYLKKYQSLPSDQNSCHMDGMYALNLLISQAEKTYMTEKQTEQLTKGKENAFRQTLHTLEEIRQAFPPVVSCDEGMEIIRSIFSTKEEKRIQNLTKTSSCLESAFLFLGDVLGESQEMVCFITELNSNPYAVWFLRENDCPLYHRYNKGLLLDEQQQAILEDMKAIDGQ